jgi:polyphenol oxidase
MIYESWQTVPDDLSAVPGFVPDWHLPKGVKAWQTTRGQGPRPYGGFNLGGHVGDDPHDVSSNRQRLQSVLPNQPVWLEQVHGTQVVTLTGTDDPVMPVADAVMTSVPGVVCGIMTADCLPVLVADRLGRVVGAAHAGWRGLLQGVLEALVAQMLAQTQSRASDLMVWLGPAIGPAAFEVGDDVRTAFLDVMPDASGKFQARGQGKWLADLPGLACCRLNNLGIHAVTQSGLCTYQSDDYYSYRREKVTGRMASMVWIDRCAL